MIIPNNLSQFKTKKFLILVSSKQNMRIYEIKKNEINLRSEIETILLPYSDNEGHFKVRSHGKVMRSGSVRESTDMSIINQFIKDFKNQIKPFKPAQYESIFLLSPSRIKNMILESLPTPFAKKIKRLIEGNFYSKSPLYILEKIADTKVEKRKPIKPKALKILKKSNRATKVIKGRHTNF